MTRNAWILALVIADFALLTGYAIEQHGYWGIIEYHLPSSAGWQVAADLVIACALACLWMFRDARSSGRNSWPFLLITLVLGSFGPLFYLLVGELRRAAAGSAGYATLNTHG